jgi:hypothetical protein
MQAMAPAVQGELQAGHTVGSEGGAAAALAAGFGAAAGAAPAVAAAAAAGAGAAAAAPARAGTANIFLHAAPGQRTVLPAASSGTCMAMLQWGQRIVLAMVANLG